MVLEYAKQVVDQGIRQGKKKQNFAVPPHLHGSVIQKMEVNHSPMFLEMRGAMGLPVPLA